MSFLSVNFLIKHYSKKVFTSYCSDLKNIHQLQSKQLKNIIKNGKNTKFGQEHNFTDIKSYSDYKRNVPLKKYDELLKYIQLISCGEKNILTNQGTEVFAETSGTLSGKKIIPISRKHLKKYISSGKSLLLNYIGQTEDVDILSGKILYLQGSPELNRTNCVPSGRLSGITHHYTPQFLKSKKIPSYKTNCISNWGKKLDQIIKECPHKELKLIAGVPPWVLHFLRRSEELLKKPCHEIYPNLNYYIQGGASYTPYKSAFESIFKERKITRLESFASSEGFIGLRHNPNDPDFTLNPQSGIFYEFISTESLKQNRWQDRCCLKEIQLGVNYVIIISSLSGLYGYLSDDIIQFTQTNPYKFKFIKRQGHSLSFFGEHLSEEEIDKAMSSTLQKLNITMVDYFIKPVIQANKKPYYQWHIELNNKSKQPENISFILDQSLMDINSYYRDLIHGNHIGASKIIFYKKDELYKYLETKGKFGGQNKMSRFSKV